MFKTFFVRNLLKHFAASGHVLRSVLGLQPSREEEELRPVDFAEGHDPRPDTICVGGWPGGGAPVFLHGKPLGHLRTASHAEKRGAAGTGPATGFIRVYKSYMPCSQILFTALFFLLLFTGTSFAEAGYGEVKTGNAEYGKGEYVKAIDNYEKAALKNSQEAKIDYDLGTAYYKKGDPAKAVEYFQKALLSDDDKLVKDVHYNLGNALYQAGIAKEDTDVKVAIARLEEALPHYEKVMAADPKDADVKNNDEFVKKELERLKKKLQQQQQSKQDQKQSQSSQTNKEQEKKSQQDQQSQQQQGQQQEQQGQPEQSGQPQAKQEQASSSQPEEKPGQGSEEQKDQGQPGEKKDEQGKSEQGQEKTSNENAQGQEQPGGEASGQEGQGQILSQKEADRLLADFDRNEQPKGLLDFIRKPREEKPVNKDW